MQTRLKTCLIAGGIALAVLPLLVVGAFALFACASPEATKPLDPQPSVTVLDLPPKPIAGTNAPIAEPAPKTREFTLPVEHVFGAEVMFGDFRVVAINRYWADSYSKMLTLEEGLKTGVCKIRESGVRGHVHVGVSGDRPVLALTGELLLGGQQDRLVARSTVLEPGTHRLPVFAAETWQWPVGPTPYGKVMNFDPQRPGVDLNVVGAIYQSSTHESVQIAIRQVTTGLEVPDAEGRGAYVASYSVPRAAGISDLVRLGRRCASVFTVGFAVYRGEELIAAEIFDSTDLLHRVCDQLLRGYAMTAIYGDISNWVVDVARAAPKQQSEPAPSQPDYTPAEDYAPPPRPLGQVTEDGMRRFDCRRDTDDHPVHIGIFRR